jgi:hypothetical protein
MDADLFLALVTVALLLWRYPAMQKRQIVWLLLSAALIDTLALGQIYTLLFLLAAVAWISMEDGHELTCVIAIGLLVAIRPPLLLWPAFLYLAGHRRLALRSLAATFAISAFPILLYGPRIYLQWVAAVRAQSHSFAVTDIALSAYFSRLGLPALGIALAAALALYLAWWMSKTKPDAATASMVSMCAAILCAPLGWVHYTLWVAPAFAAHRWHGLDNVAAALLSIPTMFVALTIIGPKPVSALGGMVYLSAVIVILCRHLLPVRHP